MATRWYEKKRQRKSIVITRMYKYIYMSKSGGGRKGCFFRFRVLRTFALAIAGGLGGCQHGGFLRLSLFLLLVQLLDGLYLFFQLHPPVLEPYLYLAFGEAQSVRHLYPPPAGQVVVGVELFLQLEGLVTGVRLSAAASESVCS